MFGFGHVDKHIHGSVVIARDDDITARGRCVFASSPFAAAAGATRGGGRLAPLVRRGGRAAAAATGSATWGRGRWCRGKGEHVLTGAAVTA